MSMPQIRRHPHVGDVHAGQPRVLQLKPDNLGQLLADRFRYSLCAMLVHATACSRAAQNHSTVTPASPGPSSEAVSCSTDCNTFSACTRSEETVTAASTARCQRSWQSISATDTLNLLCSRSRNPFTTCRFSFSEWEFSSRNSSVSTPIVAIGHTRAHSREHLGRHLLARERFQNVPRLDVTKVFDGHAALHAVAHLADIVFEPPQRAHFPGVDYHVVAQQANVASPLQIAVLHEAARHHPNFADAERVAHLGLALVHLAEHGRQQASHGAFD